MLVKQRRAGQPDEKLFKKKSQKSKIIAPPNFALPTPLWGRPGPFSPLGVALCLANIEEKKKEKGPAHCVS